MSPAASRAHAKLDPVTICLTAPIPVTDASEVELTLFPTPSCPWSFEPQHETKLRELTQPKLLPRLTPSDPVELSSFVGLYCLEPLVKVLLENSPQQ